MHAYPPYGILNIFFCPKTGVFHIFAMLGTPKPMEEIAPRHHKMFFLCLRHKNPSEKNFSEKSRTKKRDDDDVHHVQTYTPTGVALARYAPRMGGLVPWPAALAGIFFQRSKKKNCVVYYKRKYISNVSILIM